MASTFPSFKEWGERGSEFKEFNNIRPWDECDKTVWFVIYKLGLVKCILCIILVAIVEFKKCYCTSCQTLDSDRNIGWYELPKLNTPKKILCL